MMMNNIVNIMKQLNSFKQNPAQMLLQTGKITPEQYDKVRGMSPAQIGNFLMQDGVIKNDKLNELQQAAQQFQHLFS